MILVIGPESSGGQWLASLIRLHPNAPQVEHNSYPAGWGDKCTMPDYTGNQNVTDVVIPLRDKTIMRRSQERRGYLLDHPPELTNPTAIVNAITKEIQVPGRRIHFVAYAGLCGWFSKLVMADLLGKLMLNPEEFPWMEFHCHDGNEKYLRC